MSLPTLVCIRRVVFLSRDKRAVRSVITPQLVVGFTVLAGAGFL